MLLAVSERTIENSKALYTIDVTSNTLNSPFATTEAITKIVLEANNITNTASSIINPSFSLLE
ncbi:MAG: hypothetical protein ACR5KV_07390 [Wolbachia sp.]